MKKCTVCKKKYELELFNKKEHSPDGRHTACKKCQKLKQQKKQKQKEQEIVHFSFF